MGSDLRFRARLTTSLGVAEWWTEDSYFFVEYFGGGLCLSYRSETKLCEEASWYAWSSQGNPHFERCKMPFDLSWEMGRSEVNERLGMPNRNNGFVIWYDELCEFEVRLMFDERGKLYSLDVGVPDEKKHSLMKRGYELIVRRLIGRQEA